MVDRERAPCLFLSHSGIDSDAAKALKGRILASKAAKDAGLSVWLDKDDLLPGVEGWQAQIEQALTQKATAFAVLVGSRGVINWVEREVRLALTLATGADAIPFIPVLAKDAPDVAALPPFAQQHQGVFDPLGSEDALAQLVAAALARPLAEAPLLEEPFVGLRSMTEADSGRFFGRDPEVKELVAALKRHRLLAIVADSGAGKSSLAMAGLAPAFRGGAFADPAARSPDQRTWHVVTMRPGANPLEGLKRGVTEAAERMGIEPSERAALRQRLSLADASECAYALRCDLPAATTETLVIVDQFDELLTETPDAERGPFIDFLARLASLPEPGGFRVVITVRADYFNLCRPFEALYRRLADAEDPATLRLKRISDEGLEEAVTTPLRLAGYRRSDDAERLAGRARRDLGDRAGDLALAQMALFVVWRRRRPEGSLIDAYVDVGGVTGALAQEAERVRTDKLSRAEADLLTPLFARLVRLGDTGGAVRRICFRSELDSARLDLANRLCADEFGRLLLAGDDTFEICHEALITQWPWLQEELNRAAGDLREFEPLMRRAARWAAERARPGSSADAFLATGAERESMAALAARRAEWLSQAEREFVAACNGAYEADQVRAEEERQERTREQAFRRRMTRLSAVAAVLFAILAGLAGWAAWSSAEQRERAEAAASEAEWARSEADKSAQAARLNETVSLAALSRAAWLEQLPVEATKLALAAWPRKGDEARPRLARVTAALRAVLPNLRRISQFIGHRDSVSDAAFSHDGRRIASVSHDGTLRIWNTATGAEILEFEIGTASNVGFSPDGKRLVLGSENVAQIRDAQSGRVLVELNGHWDKVTAAEFSPDGLWVVTASRDNTSRIWNAETGTQAAALQGHEDAVLAAVWSPDGSTIATSSLDGTVRVWTAADASEVRVLRGHGNGVVTVDFSSDGRKLVSGGFDGNAVVWDAKNSDQLARLQGHVGTVTSAQFSLDGGIIVTGSNDRSIRIWNENGFPVAVLMDPMMQAGTPVRVTPDGRGVLSVSYDNKLKFWEIAGGQKIHAFDQWLGDVESLAISPDGRRLALGYDRGSVEVLDPTNGALLAKFAGHTGNITSVAFSPDNSRVLTTSTDQTVRIWDAADGRQVLIFDERKAEDDNFAPTAVFAPDGRTIVRSSANGAIIIADAETGEEVSSLGSKGDSVADLSSDGRRLLTTQGFYARVWDLSTGEPIARLQEENYLIDSAMFSPDGEKILTTEFSFGGGKRVRLWRSNNGTVIEDLTSSSDSVHWARFSPDGTRIITSHYDLNAVVWDAASGVPLETLGGHEDIVKHAVFSPDSTLVITGSADGTVRIWNLGRFGKGDAMQVACERLDGNITLDDVRERYGLGELVPICGDNPPVPVKREELR